MTAQHPVGMVGVGNMGGRMTRRMVDAGHDVRAVDPEPTRIPACGATPAASLAELAAACEVIMLSLPDSSVIESVIRGPGGLLDNARAGQIIVDLSTANPASTRSLHDDLAARGARYLDAGISGGAATAEVMVAGKKAGLDLAQLLEVINTSSGVSFASLSRFPHIIKGDYLEGGLTGRLMAKDVRLYLSLTEDLGAPTLIGPGTLTAFQVSNALGYGDVISNRVVDALGDLAGGIRVADVTDQEG
jgi:3-hydroxyisobutyrate dehydrogenase